MIFKLKLNFEFTKKIFNFRIEQSTSQELIQKQYVMQPQKTNQSSNSVESQEKMLSVSGKKKCSHCGDELGRILIVNYNSLKIKS